MWVMPSYFPLRRAWIPLYFFWSLVNFSQDDASCWHVVELPESLNWIDACESHNESIRMCYCNLFFFNLTWSECKLLQYNMVVLCIIISFRSAFITKHIGYCTLYLRIVIQYFVLGLERLKQVVSLWWNCIWLKHLYFDEFYNRTIP